MCWQRLALASAAVLSVLGGAVGCGGEDPFPTNGEFNGQLKGLRPVTSFTPEDKTNALLADPVKRPLAEALGDQFFHDDGWGPCQTSCETCHKAPTYADPGKALSQGCGQTGRNSPTLLNIRYGRFFFWDGRADSAWAQATGPLQHPNEIGATPEGVKQRMVERYADAYQAVFGALPSEHDPERVMANFGKAIQAYLWTKKFVALNSRFDTQLKEFIDVAQQIFDTGDEGLQKQLESMPNYLGLKTFVRKGQCIVCHKNWVMSDDLFHNIGVAQRSGHEDKGLADGYEQLLGNPYRGSGIYSDAPSVGGAKADNLFTSGITRDQALGAFKTPTLRNVEQTGPYMHDGSLATLEDVIEFYDRGGDPEGMYPGQRADTIQELELEDEEKAALLDLLRSMTGQAEAP